MHSTFVVLSKGHKKVRILIMLVRGVTDTGWASAHTILIHTHTHWQNMKDWTEGFSMNPAPYTRMWTFPVYGPQHGKHMRASNYPIAQHMLIQSAFKLSSGMIQDYANSKSIFLAAMIKRKHLEMGLNRERILYHVGFRDVVDAGHFYSHGHVHRWTCGGEKRKPQIRATPSPFSSHPLSITPSPMCLSPES